MNPHNQPIADAFVEIANLLELRQAGRKEIEACRRAARALAAMPASVRAILRRGESLDTLAAIDESLAQAAAQLAETGSCTLLEGLHDASHDDLSELFSLPMLGPQRVRMLYEELGVSTLEQLQEAALAGRLQLLPGFGPRLEQQILREAAATLERARRLRLDIALPLAHRLRDWIAGMAGVARVEFGGCLRRRCDSVANLDLVAESESARDVVAAFANHPDVREIPFAGRARVGVVLDGGIGARLHVASQADFGAAWLSGTGSRAHLQVLARRAHQRRMTFDDTGLHRAGVLAAAADEAAVYGLLGLAFVEPELREDQGEIAAAEGGRLPTLVRRQDLRGDLRVQSRQGAVEIPLEAIVAGARAQGLSYVAVADTLHRLQTTRTNDLDRFGRLIDRIDEFNAAHADFVILKGVHADILEDGRLNVPDTILARADLVVASLGHAFGLTRARQTDRLLRAMDNRFFSLLGSPTGRLIEERRPAAMDLARVLRKAQERACFVELDCRPARLDLDDAGCRLARDLGVLVSVDSCALAPAGLAHLDLGVGQARRGWLEPADVLNTRDIADVRALLAPTMAR